MRWPKNVPIINELDSVAWTDWTPTFSSAVGSPTLVTLDSARYRSIGKVVTFVCKFTLTTIGTASADLRITLPFTQASATGGANGRNETNTQMIQCYITSGLCVMWTMTNAFPLVQGQTISLQGSYRRS